MSISNSQILNPQDFAFHQVQDELATTDYFDLESMSVSQSLCEGLVKFNHFRTSASEKLPTQWKVLFFAQHKSEQKQQPQSDQQRLTWALLEEVFTVIKAANVDWLATRLIKPTQALSGALELCLGNAQLTDEFKQELERIAEQHQIQCTLVNVKSGLPTITQPGLLVMDMDSTAIQIECIDEIAKLAGVGEQVAKVTASAMRGELDFAESLHARVATLKGAPKSIIEQVAGNLPLMPGLEALVAELKQHGWRIAIVSGGFTAMTEALRVQLNLDKTIANELDFNGDTLTGTVSGAVVDAQAKADAVQSLAKLYNIDMNQTIAMGDGANDLKMMAVAKLGVAFHAKPIVNEQADASVKSGGLDQLLYLIS